MSKYIVILALIITASPAFAVNDTGMKPLKVKAETTVANMDMVIKDNFVKEHEQKALAWYDSSWDRLYFAARSIQTKRDVSPFIVANAYDSWASIPLVIIRTFRSGF